MHESRRHVGGPDGRRHTGSARVGLRRYFPQQLADLPFLRLAFQPQLHGHQDQRELLGGIVIQHWRLERAVVPTVRAIDAVDLAAQQGFL